MGVFKRTASVLIILFLLLVTIPFGGDVSSAETPPVRSEIICNWMYADEAGDAIDEAEESIHVAMYLVVVGYTVEWLIDKLVGAQDRGVEVRIIMDNEPEVHHDDTFEYLEDRGLTVKMDNSDKMLHSKMLIIDNRTVIIGSTNWTDNSINNNNEANARIDDERVAAYYERYFWEAWADDDHDFELGIENYGGITPLVDRDYFPNVRDAIDNATERVFILHYAFKLSGYDDSLSDLLFDSIVNASRRGVNVKVCLEYSDWEDYINEMNQYTINKFVSSGVDAFFEDEWQITHTKLIVVDDATILGSTNWAYSGLNLHHNADVIIRDRGFTEDIIYFYSDLWGDYVPPGEVKIHRQLSSYEVEPGGDLEITGYVWVDDEVYPDAELSYWLEDENGDVVTKRANVVTDADGEYEIGMTVPERGGTFTLKMSVNYEGNETVVERKITVTGSDQEEPDEEKGLSVKVLVILGVFGFVGIVLFLRVLFKKE